MPAFYTKEYFSVSVNGHLRNDSEDSISIYKGDKLVATLSNSTGLSSYATTVFLYSPVFIKFHSGPSTSTIYRAPTISVNMGTYLFADKRNVILTEENPIFVPNTSEHFNGYYNISVPEGYTLDVSLAVDSEQNDVFDEYEIHDGLEFIGE